MQKPKPTLDRSLEAFLKSCEMIFYVENQTLERFGIGINEDSSFTDPSCLSQSCNHADGEFLSVFCSRMHVRKLCRAQSSNYVRILEIQGTKIRHQKMGSFFCPEVSTMMQMKGVLGYQ